MARLQLGPFDLIEPLDRGGMSQVWAAVHRTQGVPVAVKVLSPRSSRRDWMAAFRNEVRAVARLDHPNIVCVLDHGELPDDVALPGLPDGAAYLVMERADTTLDQVAVHMRWPALRGVLLSLVEALAHAHARGVVHCDLKASNVLLGGLRSGPKLTDFGIARAAGLAFPEPERRVGTPSHMAPEQFGGTPGDLGPWTDLYALGCMTWKLVTGRPPFRGKRWGEYRRAHERSPLPELRPRMRVPAALEDLLADLMAKDPSDRLQRAADVGQRLRTLEEEPSSAPLPVPLDWRRDDGDGSPPELVGAGLGLFGQRTIPMVGRDQERDALWGALREVVDTRRPRVVALRGGAGLGRGRLARWLCERAHEVGVAEVLRAGPVAPHSDPTSAMLARTLSCEGLDFAAARERVAIRLRLEDPAELDAIASLVAEDGPVGFPSAEARHAVATRVLERLSLRGCCVAWLEGADDDARGFVRRLLDGPALPALVLWTPRGEVPRDLHTRRGVEVLTIAPLEGAERVDLVRATLGVTPELAARVASVTRGSPLLTVQLIRAWVERGWLEPTDRGYTLADDRVSILPRDLHELWTGRLHQAVGDDALRALEVAAALAPEIHDDTWRAACEALGVHPAGARQLLDAGLARGHEGRWRFSHELLAESLRWRADRAGRWASIHLACAEVEEDVARRGLHLVEGGCPEEAAKCLLEGVRQAVEAGRIHAAAQLLEPWSVALTEVTDDGSDDRWAEGWLLEVRIARIRGDMEGAEAAATRLIERAEGLGWERVASQARLERSVVRQVVGRLDEAQADVERAVAGTDDEGLEAAAHLRSALIALNRSDLDHAEDRGGRAVDHYERFSNDAGSAAARIVLGGVALRRGKVADALAFAERAVATARHGGALLGMAEALNLQGEALRVLGRLEEAEATYEEALRLYSLVGAWDALLPRVNLALVQIDRGDTDRARQTLESVLGEITTHSQVSGVLHAYLLPCVARSGEWDLFAKHLSEAAATLHATGFVDPDVARLAEVAAIQAELAGEHELAVGARDLSEAQARA